MSQATWWQQTTAAALLGTQRREPPALPDALGIVDRPDSTPATALLDAAAVGGALLRARPRHRTATDLPAPAAPDLLPVAPPAAVQLLVLLLDQPPVAARLRPLALERWLTTAAARGVRVPASTLTRLLALATQQADLRPATVPVLDERGRWLAGVRSEWAWAAAPPTDRTAVVPPTPEQWRALPAAERAAALPALAAELDLLEEALDDRSDKVRRQALALLDAAPTSARAARMAARLRPLVTPTGLLRRGLEVALPTAPDDAGVRDGLTATRSGSQRERWLELICAGAPLSVWTEASGRDPAHTWRMITEPAARAGILRAVRARAGTDEPTDKSTDEPTLWAEAALEDQPGLLEVLPPARRDAAAVRLLRGGATPPLVAAVLTAVPAPWSEALSSSLVDVLTRSKPAPGAMSAHLPRLAAGLHPAVRPRVSAWARSEHHWGSLPADLDQFLSFLPAITEAFR